MRKLQKICVLFLLLTAVFLSGCAKGNDDQSSSEPESSVSSETEAVPVTIRFEATDLEGNAVSSDVFAQSKLTMFNVWATYCGPCLNEMPELGELAEEYDGADLQLIGIVSDVMEGEDQTLAESLVQETGADYPHLLLNRSLYDALLSNVSAVPTTFFLDSDGTPLGYVVGARENRYGRRSSMDFWKNCKQHAWVLGVLTGVLFLGVGATQGQFAVIWKKAVMICLECIGIG